jgi:hypothetical protein
LYSFLLIRRKVLKILCFDGFEFDAIDIDEGLVGGVAIRGLNGSVLGCRLRGEDVVGGGHEIWRGKL